MSPPLVVAFALAGTVDIDLDEGAARHRAGRRAGLPARRLAHARGGRGAPRRRVRSGGVPAELRRLRRRTRAGTRSRCAAARSTSGTPSPRTSRSRPTSCPFARLGRDPRRRDGRAGAGHLRRLGHHRPHQPGRLHQADLARGPVPPVAGRLDRGLQQLRRAARQPPRDGARHVRERADQEPDGPGRRGRRHRPPARPGDGSPSTRRRMEYAREGVPLCVIAGQEYGTGSSRDWAAKGTALLGVRAVVARSFERIHRSNLVGMGVLPCQLAEGVSAQTPRPRRQRDVRADRHRRGARPAAAGDAGGAADRRQGRAGAGHGADRHAHRGRVLPARRHHAVRAPPESSGAPEQITRGAARAWQERERGPAQQGWGPDGSAGGAGAQPPCEAAFLPRARTRTTSRP